MDPHDARRRGAGLATGAGGAAQLGQCPGPKHIAAGPGWGSETEQQVACLGGSWLPTSACTPGEEGMAGDEGHVSSPIHARGLGGRRLPTVRLEPPCPAAIPPETCVGQWTGPSRGDWRGLVLPPPVSPCQLHHCEAPPAFLEAASGNNSMLPPLLLPVGRGHLTMAVQLAQDSQWQHQATVPSHAGSHLLACEWLWEVGSRVEEPQAP